MKKLMILGSTKYFVNIVNAAREMGVYTIVCDGKVNSPAKLICDKVVNIDISDLEGIKKVAIENNVDGIISGFSDVLVKPYVHIANELGLVCGIREEQVETFTDKVIMKKILKNNNINIIDYIVLESEKDIDTTRILKYPLVIKPIDNSGSKGIYFVDNEEQLKEKFNLSIKYSEKGKVIVEEFYESTEIQGMAWVNNGEVHVMYMGDRELVNIHKGRPGKPKRLMYPSIFCYQYEAEIKEIFNKIAKAFNISNGPIYTQMLIGDEGIKVAETMIRLPGGCDYIAISRANNFSIERLLVNYSIGEDIDLNELKKVNMRLNNCVYAIPIYLKPGKIKKISGIEKIKELDFIFGNLFDAEEGQIIEGCGDMRQDCGRFFGIAPNIFIANKQQETIKNLLSITDENEEEMINNI